MSLTEKVVIKISHWLPRRIAYWCFIRVHVFANSTMYSDLHPDEVTYSMAAKAWEKGHGL